MGQILNKNTQKRTIPLSKPYFKGGETELIQKVLDSGWVTQGPMVEKFESLVAEYVSSKFAIATSNCTTAMHIGWLIHGVGPGDEVICPSYSFIASANAVRHVGAEPVFVDICPETLNIDAKAVSEYINNNYDKKLVNKNTGKTLKAILAVHQIGIPADLDELSKIAKTYGITLVEDAACALGSSYKNIMIGSSGNTCAFSFHPRKVITTGEGGMLTFSDNKLNEQARIYRTHGMSISDLDRHRGNNTAFEAYDVIGYNYRMTDIQAAIGIKQMDVLDACIEKRANIAAQYNEVFSKLPGVKVLNSLPDYITKWNYQSYTIRLVGAGVDKRNKFMDYLISQGVSAKRGIPPIHQEPIYKANWKLPLTEAVSEESLFIPIFSQMTESDVDYVIEKVVNTHSSLC
jgi:dTDP-4-amino-4,6-dideoxygalactose transaminase